MSSFFSPQDILRVAIEVEKNGMGLYEVLEGKAQDEKVKKIWRYLKEQEEIHAKNFQQMLDNVGDYLVHEINRGEYSAYLNAIASEYIVTQELMEKKKKEEFNSDLEAVNFGIYIEKESILTYSALKEYMLTAKQGELQRIIDEEKKHLADLTLIKKSLKERG